jgi:hypothetical protein
MSLRATAAAAHYDPGMLSKVLAGKRNASPYLAARLDEALGAGGEIRAAVSGRRADGKSKPAAWRGATPSAAVLALQAAMNGDPAELDVAADGLAELVRYYAHAVSVTPSGGVYAELLSARTFAGTQAGRTSVKGRPELTVSAGCCRACWRSRRPISATTRRRSCGAPMPSGRPGRRAIPSCSAGRR